MDDIRDYRLAEEFELMKALVRPQALVEFWCADLSATETPAFLRAHLAFEVITEGFPGFLEPMAYEARFPGVPPEKYLIKYHCKGLWKADDRTFVEAPFHLMEVVFGADYPSNPPTFVWLTPIWHPNLQRPYICLEGRPFAVGWTLDLIVQEVGRLVQYQSYNVNDPLNREAADWARENRHLFPVDDRDLLDSTIRVGQASQTISDSSLVDELDDPENLIEILVDSDN